MSKIQNLTLLLFSLTVVIQVVSGTPGKAGKKWSTEEVKIIQEKLKRLWNDPGKILQEFDPVKENAEFRDFVYDPTDKTLTPDCKCCCPSCSRSTSPNCTKAENPKPNQCQYDDNNMCSSAWNVNK